MAERDWTKELSKIDRQLESISDEALFPTKGGPAKGPAAAARVDNLEKQRTTSTFGDRSVSETVAKSFSGS